jgi:hypothetical protein
VNEETLAQRGGCRTKNKITMRIRKAILPYEYLII